MADEYRSNIPPGNFPKEESRQIEFPRENRFFSFLKNILVFLVLVGIVVASFMVSFQLGKKILVPTKKAPEKITAAIPETPPSLKSLQKLQALMSAEAVGKEAKKAAAPKKHKRHCRKSGAAGRPARGSYYKIQAGLFADKAQAAELAETMKTAGIDIYIKKVGGSWRVQAGAYRTRDMADKAAAEVEAKGFKSQVIFE